MDIGIRYFTSGCHTPQRGYKRQQVHRIISSFRFGAERWCITTALYFGVALCVFVPENVNYHDAVQVPFSEVFPEKGNEALHCVTVLRACVYTSFRRQILRRIRCRKPCATGVPSSNPSSWTFPDPAPLFLPLCFLSALHCLVIKKGKKKKTYILKKKAEDRCACDNYHQVVANRDWRVVHVCQAISITMTQCLIHLLREPRLHL